MTTPPTGAHGKPCFYCQQPINIFAGNPNEWPLEFPQPDGTGQVKAHHVGCVVKRLVDYATAHHAGQEAMRERAAKEVEKGWAEWTIYHGHGPCRTCDRQRDHWQATCAKGIRTLAPKSPREG